MTRTLELTPERIDRFWTKVERGTPDECWTWTAEKHSNGYGIFTDWTGGRHRFLAHRMALLIAGVVVGDQVVRHDCDNPPCVNPAHLRTGTQADNIRDAVERGRMNMEGLAMGQVWVPPAHPCLRCGATIEGSRRLRCEPCRQAHYEEYQAAYAARRAARRETQAAA